MILEKVMSRMGVSGRKIAIIRTFQKYLLILFLQILALPISYLIRIEEQFWSYNEQMLILAAILFPILALSSVQFRLAYIVWRKISLPDLWTLSKSVVPSFGVLLILTFTQVLGFTIPRSIPFIYLLVGFLMVAMLLVGIRIHYEYVHSKSIASKKFQKRVLVVGAGEAGTVLVRELMRHDQSELLPVGFLDDDSTKHGLSMGGIQVFGSVRELPYWVDNLYVDEVIIAMPSQRGQFIRSIVEYARSSNVPVRSIPAMYDIFAGNISLQTIRNVQVEDLLRRDPVKLNLDTIRGYISGKTVLVSGAGGSIGSEIVRQIAKFNPMRVILLGRGENSIYLIHREVVGEFAHIEWIPFIADVRDNKRIRNAFSVWKPDVVFHAAAHKHVPMMELNPEEAVINNIFGTKNMAEAALDFGTKYMVNVSTDKAVNPTSVMGASKRLAEYMVQNAARRAGKNQRFVSVRFGNVLGSRGSVVPLFKKQISEGGPITITHPDMVRYFMTIPEASRLVIQAGGMGQNGSVYVLDMGEPVKIVDLARDLILLSGLKPDVDIKITYTGSRPGEKLFEELLTAEEGTTASAHAKIFTAKSQAPDPEDIELLLKRFMSAVKNNDQDLIRQILKDAIPMNQLKLLD